MTLWGIFLSRYSRLGHPLDLAFAAHVHGVIALDRPLRWLESPTPPFRVNAAFHTPMILFHRCGLLATSHSSAG
jgi:hypothetical protein